MINSLETRWADSIVYGNARAFPRKLFEISRISNHDFKLLRELLLKCHFHSRLSRSMVSAVFSINVTPILARGLIFSGIFSSRTCDRWRWFAHNWTYTCFYCLFMRAWCINTTNHYLFLWHIGQYFNVCRSTVHWPLADAYRLFTRVIGRLSVTPLDYFDDV